MEVRTIVRTYPAICTSCAGVGSMTNPNFNPNVTADFMIINCPICLGSGQIIITETFEEQYTP